MLGGSFGDSALLAANPKEWLRRAERLRDRAKVDFEEAEREVETARRAVESASRQMPGAAGA